DRLGVVAQLLVAPAHPARRLRRVLSLPRGDLIVGAVAKAEAARPEAAGPEEPELVARERADERLGAARERRLDVGLADRGADRGELDQVRAPVVGPAIEPDADDAGGAEELRLLAKPADRGVPRLVVGLRERGKL